MSRWFTAQALFSAAIALPVVAFDAQTPMSAPGGTVPREVMAVLMQGPDPAPGEAFELRVGGAAVPAEFPRDLLPAGTTVNATAATQAGLTVVGTLASFGQADRPAFESALESAGWIDEGIRPRGLTSTALGAPIAACRGDRFATVTFTPRPTGGSFVRASVVRDARRTCAAARRPSTYGDLPLPSLRPPSGAESSGANIGGSATAMYSSVRLRTGQPIEEIASHYASQLSAAGWKIDGQTTEPRALAITRLSGSSTTGEPLNGMLLVTALPAANQVDVLLRVVR